MSLHENLIKFSDTIYENCDYPYTSLWMFVFYSNDKICTECRNKLMDVIESISSNPFMKNTSLNLKVIIDDCADRNQLINGIFNDWARPIFVFVKKDGIIDIIKGNPSSTQINEYIKEYIY